MVPGDEQRFEKLIMESIRSVKPYFGNIALELK